MPHKGAFDITANKLTIVIKFGSAILTNGKGKNFIIRAFLGEANFGTKFLAE